MSSSESALVKPFRSVFRFVGMFVDAIYHFVNSLFNPGGATYNSRGQMINTGRGLGPQVRTLRPHGSGGNAPNMSVGGCRSCM